MDPEQAARAAIEDRQILDHRGDTEPDTSILSQGPWKLERPHGRQTIMQLSMLGRAFAVAVICAAALGATGCGIGWQDQTISRVSVSGDGRSLEVGWHCHHDADVEVQESESEVRLRFRVHSYKGDCADVERSTLSSALGDRRIIDSTTGKTVTPCQAQAGAEVEIVDASNCQ